MTVLETHSKNKSDLTRIVSTSRLRLARTKSAELAPWFAAVGIILGGNLAANAIGEALELWETGASSRFSFLKFSYVIFFAATVFWFYKVRPVIFRPRTRFLRDIESPAEREHLVLFLSGLDLEKGSYVDGVPKGIVLSGDIDRDISALEVHKRSNPPWRWEMPLRAIRHHVGKLKSITFICSPDSIKQAPLLYGILKKYQCLDAPSIQILAKDGNRPVLVRAAEISQRVDGWEFERFDQLSEALDYLLNLFKENEVAEKQIMIDFTGGVKVTSVVAAAMTFNRRIEAQYVQTNPPWKVVSYDILMGSGDTPGVSA